MTSAEKEEYHYLFDKYHNFNMPIDLRWAVILWLTMALYILVSWILFKIPPTGFTEQDAFRTFILGMRIGIIIIIIIIVEIISWIIITIQGYIKEYKWLKQREI